MITQDLKYSIDDLDLSTPLYMQEPTPSAENTSDLGPGASFGSGQFIGNTTMQDGYLKSANFVTGVSGWYLDPDTGEFNFAVSVDAIDIPDTTTANSFHVDNQGNAWWGATTLANAPASVSKSGQGKFVGLTSLNAKAYTNFETAARFITTGGGGGTTSFGNQGLSIDPTATATRWARCLWQFSGTIFSNSPVFSCILQYTVFVAQSLDGVFFAGLGTPTIDGTSLTNTGVNYCGFVIRKVAGVVSLYAQQCDGSGSATTSSPLTTIGPQDFLELLIKVNPASIDYYYRINGAPISAATTLSSTLPSGQELYATFEVSNETTAEMYPFNVFNAGYEH